MTVTLVTCIYVQGGNECVRVLHKYCQQDIVGDLVEYHYDQKIRKKGKQILQTLSTDKICNQTKGFLGSSGIPGATSDQSCSVIRARRVKHAPSN